MFIFIPESQAPTRNAVISSPLLTGLPDFTATTRYRRRTIPRYSLDVHDNHRSLINRYAGCVSLIPHGTLRYSVSYFPPINRPARENRFLSPEFHFLYCYVFKILHTENQRGKKHVRQHGMFVWRWYYESGTRSRRGNIIISDERWWRLPVIRLNLSTNFGGTWISEP